LLSVSPSIGFHALLRYRGALTLELRFRVGEELQAGAFPLGTLLFAAFDVHARRRSVTEEFPVITGFASMLDSDAGGLPRLAKPFRQTELNAAVAELLDEAGAE
jgi:hypothetical protein